jgi:hypothetical protein
MVVEEECSMHEMKASANEQRRVTQSHANTVKRGCAGQAFGLEFGKWQFLKTVAEIWQVPFSKTVQQIGP